MNVNKKFFFFLRSLGTGGTENQVLLLSHRLIESGYEVKLITLYAGEWDKRASELKIPVHCLKKKRTLGFLISKIIL